jgi:hypothetical protein
MPDFFVLLPLGFALLGWGVRAIDVHALLAGRSLAGIAIGLAGLTFIGIGLIELVGPVCRNVARRRDERRIARQVASDVIARARKR